MADVKIVIGSITYAMKAKKIVNEYGITASVVKYEGLQHRGCSYGIKIRYEQYMSVVGILSEHGIRHRIADKTDDSLS